MRKFLFLFIVLFSLNVNAQTISLEKDRRNIGIAEKLIGEVNVLSIYVNDGHKFSPKMKNDYSSELIKAEDWILAEATKHNIKLKFNNYSCGVDGSVVYKPICSWYDVMPQDVIISAFGSETKARIWFNEHPNCAVILFVGDARGQYCSAVSISKIYGSKKPYLEGAKIYPYEMHEKYLEIAHEILHLFGACDLYDGVTTYKDYYGCDRKEWNNNLLNLRYSAKKDKKSIMFDVALYDLKGNKNKHYIDELTAHLIGWDNNWKNWYAYYIN